MSIPKYEEGKTLEYISSLSRLPNTSDNLTWKQLQKKFDKAIQDFQEWWNTEAQPAITTDILAVAEGITPSEQMEGTKISPSTLPGDRIDPENPITSARIGQGEVKHINIDEYAVEYSNIAENAVHNANILNGEVNNDKITPNTITSDRIKKQVKENGVITVVGGIETDNIQDNAITADKIADNAAAKTVNGNTGNVVITIMKEGTTSEFTEDEDETLNYYPYIATVTDEDISANDKVYVEFNAEQINNDIYASIVISGEGYFRIFSSSEEEPQTISYTIIKG